MNISEITGNKSSEPAYVQLSKELEKYIHVQHMTAGEKLPGIKEIAESGGVSLKTAERALDILIKNGICFRRPKRGTFVANANLASESLGPSSVKTDLIVFLVIGSTEGDPYYMRVLRGAEEASSAKEFNLVFLSAPYKNEKALLKKLEPIAKRKDLKAVLLGGKLDDDSISLIEKSFDGNLPIVIMGRTAGGFYKNLSHVTDSNGLALRTALQFLYEKGHRNIAFLNGSLYWSWNSEMREEFYQFLRTKDLPRLKDCIKDNLPDDEDINGYQAAMEIIPSIKKNAVTSVVCATDKLAQGAMRALQENGFSIPEDISVVGLGNLGFGKYLSPPLTTVDQCEEEKGREGVNVATGTYCRGNIIKVPVKLIERMSTASLK